MNIEVIVPFAGDCPYRQTALEWTVNRYRWPVTIAGGGTPWIKARAVMPAIHASAADIIVMADADVWCDAVTDAVVEAEAGTPWVVPHRGVFRLTEAATQDLTADRLAEPYDLTERAYRGIEGGGIVVARRDTLLACPMDPRFVGWGGEDEAWGWALRTLYGPAKRLRGQLLHLWHPPQDRVTRKRGSDTSWALRNRYHHALDDPAAMRHLLAEAQDDLDATQPTLHHQPPDRVGHC